MNTQHCTFPVVMSLLRTHAKRQYARNSAFLLEALFASYLEANQIPGFAPSSVGRWVSGARDVPTTIADYYDTDAGQQRLYTDVCAGILPALSDVSLTIDALQRLVLSDDTLSEAQKVLLTAATSDPAALIADLIVFTITRPHPYYVKNF